MNRDTIDAKETPRKRGRPTVSVSPSRNAGSSSRSKRQRRDDDDQRTPRKRKRSPSRNRSRSRSKSQSRSRIQTQRCELQDPTPSDLRFGLYPDDDDLDESLLSTATATTTTGSSKFAAAYQNHRHWEEEKTPPGLLAPLLQKRLRSVLGDVENTISIEEEQARERAEEEVTPSGIDYEGLNSTSIFSSSKHHITAVTTTTRNEGVDWLSFFDIHRNTLQDRLKSYEESLQIRKRREISTDPLRDLARNVGDMRVADVHKILNNMGKVPSPDQKTFFLAFIQACLPHIYKDDWDASSQRVLEEYEILRIAFEVLIMTPRRFGKTVAVSMLLLALLLCVPGIRICVFSTCQRTSSALLEIILQILGTIPGARNRIVKQTQKELFIAGQALEQGVSANSHAAKGLQHSKDTSKLFSFPSTVAGNIIIIIIITQTLRDGHKRRGAVVPIH